jgi:hypothetical protein
MELLAGMEELWSVCEFGVGAPHYSFERALGG